MAPPSAAERGPARRLGDGRVLVTGGSTVSSAPAKGYVNNTGAEIYDPVANTWTATRAAPISPRSQHAATLLPSGLVLITGGFDIVDGLLTPLATAELYDPVLHTTTRTDIDGVTTTTITGGLDFAATTPMAFAHYGQSATRLADGRVVVVGGNTTQTELYDPTVATWTTQGATAATHTSHGAALLPDGRLLVVGGTQFAQPTAELFDPATGLWTAAARMRVIRSNPTATLMPDGSVMVCGGALDASGANCETYW